MKNVMSYFILNVKQNYQTFRLKKIGKISKKFNWFTMPTNKICNNVLI